MCAMSAEVKAACAKAARQARAEQWLDRNLTDAGKAMELLQPNPDDAIAFHRVSTRVSNARDQGADLIEAV